MRTASRVRWGIGSDGSPLSDGVGLPDTQSSSSPSSSLPGLEGNAGADTGGSSWVPAVNLAQRWTNYALAQPSAEEMGEEFFPHLSPAGGAVVPAEAAPAGPTSSPEMATSSPEMATSSPEMAISSPEISVSDFMRAETDDASADPVAAPAATTASAVAEPRAATVSTDASNVADANALADGAAAATAATPPSSEAAALVPAQWWHRAPPARETKQHVVIIRHGKTEHNKARAAARPQAALFTPCRRR